MTMKNDQPRLINYWKLFLLRYLLLGKGFVDFTPCQKEAHELLEQFLDLASKFNFEKISAGIDEQTANYLLKKNKKDEGGFVEKANNGKLTVKDLSLLLDSYLGTLNNSNQIESARDIIESLVIAFDFEQSETKTKNLLDVYVEAILRGESKTDRRIAPVVNYYSYYYQKNHFIKSIPRYLEECGSDEINLFEERNEKLFGEDDNRATFLETMLALEREGLVSIINMGIADSKPIKTIKILHTNAIRTFPPIMATIKIEDSLKRSFTSSKTTPTPTSQLPSGWGLKVDNEQLHVTKYNQIIFTFKNRNAKYCRYFRCLWYNHGRTVTYPEIYEYEIDKKYPYAKGENYKKNNDIRRLVNFLKKKFEEKSIPIKIKVSNGCILTIEE